MCENCWTGEVNAFEDERSWTEFNVILAGKLEDGVVSYNSVNHEHSIYKCASCGEAWKLKTPEEFPSGYFLLMKTGAGSKSIPSTIAIIIVIGILAVLFAKLFQYIFGN
jgi:hypothetical protein